MSAGCGHLICELIVLLRREVRYTGEPSVDDYHQEPGPCFIREHQRGEQRPHFDKSTVDDAVRYVERLKPDAVRAEIERLHLLHAARALAKFVSSEAGNRELLRARLTDAVDETRKAGQPTATAQGMADRLYDLGILQHR
jgi:hypothetical protein